MKVGLFFFDFELVFKYLGFEFMDFGLNMSDTNEVSD